MSLYSAPVSIVVECEIQADRIDDFLDVIEKDAVGSRNEKGCLRFGKSLNYLYNTVGESSQCSI
jgi:quinol monooxygenase YgiN